MIQHKVGRQRGYNDSKLRALRQPSVVYKPMTKIAASNMVQSTQKQPNCKKRCGKPEQKKIAKFKMEVKKWMLW